MREYQRARQPSAPLAAAHALDIRPRAARVPTAPAWPHRFARLDPAGPPIQREVRIKTLGGKRIPPTGKAAQQLWDELTIHLYDAGYSPYGLKSHFTTMLREEKVSEFADVAEFAQRFVGGVGIIHFGESARAEQEKNLNVKKKDRARRTVHPFRLMTRPAWPKSYAATLKSKAGDNIRHIVRNKTLRDAVMAEYELVKTQKNELETLQYFQTMAGELGAEKADHVLPQLNEIYKKLYLHLGNLFAGGGGVNQAIGLAADPIIKIADKLETRAEAPVDVSVVIGHVLQAVNNSLNLALNRASKLGEEAKQQFFKGMQGYDEHIKEYLKSLQIYWTETHAGIGGLDPGMAPAEDLAGDVREIGDNLGLDLIVQDPQGGGNVAKRQAGLIEVETKLLNQQYTKGSGELTGIFKTFLSAR